LHHTAENEGNIAIGCRAASVGQMCLTTIVQRLSPRPTAAISRPSLSLTDAELTWA